VTLTTSRRLVDHLRAGAKGRKISEVRIGLGYTAVALDSGQAGVAWTPRSEARGCTHLQSAGTLAGQPAGALLEYLAEGPSDLARAIGLATANALLAALPRPPGGQDDVLVTLGVAPEERVVMVGYFRPLVARLRATGCRLDIVERIPSPGETLTPEQGEEALAHCDVALITGTCLINGTCDRLLAHLGQPRAAVLLGPSSPLCPEVFRETRITHLAGARVRDAQAVLRIVSEGGGTMVLKPHMDFETAVVLRP